MKIYKFNFKIFLIATIICGILTFITFIAVFGISEGTIETNLFTLTLEKLFYVFRFPIHTFFFDKMKGDTFVWGLFFNCLFYGLVIERSSSAYKNKKDSTMKTSIIFLLTLFLASCNNDEKFDKVKWQEQGDLKIYIHRKSMLNDLTKNYKLTELTYRQLINLVG